MDHVMSPHCAERSRPTGASSPWVAAAGAIFRYELSAQKSPQDQQRKPKPPDDGPLPQPDRNKKEEKSQPRTAEDPPPNNGLFEG